MKLLREIFRYIKLLFKYVFNTKWQAYELSRGLKNHNFYSNDHNAGKCLSTIMGIYIIIIIGIICPVMYLHGYIIISSFIFFYFYMLFVNMIPFYINKKYRSFYNNISIWVAVLSITSSISGHDLVGLIITLSSDLLIVLKGFIDLNRK